MALSYSLNQMQHCRPVDGRCTNVMLFNVRQDYGGFIVLHALGSIQSDPLLTCGVALSPITEFENCGNSLAQRRLNFKFVCLLCLQKINREYCSGRWNKA